jgi:DeoR/GlpR family transcriptional regulator of sugar metabolism
MLTQERHDTILTKLAEDGKVVATELATEFGVSEDTVRRDLRELAKAGVCRRVYGGALPPVPDLGTIAQRRQIMVESKLRLANVVADLITPGQTVFIDAGSTNLAVVQSLPRNLDAIIVTNAPAIALALSEHTNCRTVLLGGRFHAANGSCLGGQTLRDIRMVNADVFVLGTCGIDPHMGVSTLDAEEAEIKRCMAEQSGKIIIAATADKVGTVAPFAVTDTGSVGHLVVSADGDPTKIDAFRALGVPTTVA